jgi:D-sedoheptulose 7-phosphate isomerase
VVTSARVTLLAAARLPSVSAAQGPDQLRALVDDHIDVARRMRDDLLPLVEGLALAICASLAAGGKLLTFGNGGSAADAQHFAAELTGHFAAARRPLAAVALSTDTSALTAIANDFEFADVFARQVTALARAGDVVVAISTSGGSENVVRGIRAAAAAGARTWALTGGTGGRLRESAERSIVVPSPTTARVQEMHITIIHMVCTLIDAWAVEQAKPS